MPPPNPLARAKKAIDAKEAKLLGKKWKTEVTTATTTTTTTDGAWWKPYEEWAAQYEPKKEKKEKKPESERKNKAKTKAQEKLKTTILSKVHHGVANKMMLVLLEMASRILSKAEEETSKLKGKNEVTDVLPKILNACSGLILTFRFDHNNKKTGTQRKLSFLRREASNQLTEIFHTLVSKARTGTSTVESILQQVHGEITKILNSKQEFLKQEVSKHLDDLLQMGVTKMDDTVDAKLEKAQEQIAGLKVQAEGALDAVGAPKVDADIDAGVAETVKGSLRPKEQVINQRDAILANFAGMLKQTIAREMERLTQVLATMLGELCTVFCEALQRIDDANKEKAKETVEKQMFKAVEDAYVQLDTKVSEEVQQVVDMLGGMMTAPNDDSDAGEDEEDDEE